MNRSLFIAPFLMMSYGLPVHALDFGDGFSTVGEFELEYFDAGSPGGGDTIGYASADISYQQPAGGFGGFVGFDAFSTEGTSEAAIYGALSFSGGFGKIQVGVPRAALDDYIEMPPLGGLRIIDLEFGSLSRSIITTAYLFQSLDAPLGVRYDGQFGDAKIGASYHHVDDADVVDVAVNYQVGNAVIRAGVEVVDQGGSSRTSYHLGANATFGKVETGILLSDANAFGDLRAAQVFAKYSPIDRLNVTGTIFSLNGGSGTNTLYGVAADYTFSQGAYLEAGVADGSGTDSLYNLSLGLKF